MNLYELPQIKLPKLKKGKGKGVRVFGVILAILFLSSLFGFLSGIISGSYFYLEIKDYLSQLNIELPEMKTVIEKEYIPQTSQEEKIIKVVESVSPAVVSIVISKDVSIFEEYFINPFQDFEGFFGEVPQFQVPQYRLKGTETQEIGWGTGFIVSEDGMVLTNKHVVLDEEADYTVFTNQGKKYPATVLDRDKFQDIAVLKIEQEKIVDDKGELQIKSFPVAEMGNSEGLKIGQTVVAIGNALGEFRNTVSVGVVSGLGRKITASGGNFVETLENVIQTDTAINKGNSGGPLLNLAGNVIGINTAMVEGAQSIGFAIPINRAAKDVENVRTLGKIVYPFLGIRYVLLTESLQKENDLSVSYGAWIKGDNGEEAIYPGSAAEEAGLAAGDILLEFNGEKITKDNSLAKIIQEYNPGDRVSLKFLREDEEQTVYATLGEKDD